MNYIFFWRPYPCPDNSHIMSQFYPCNFNSNGIDYNCAEQYMMAQKALLFNDQLTYQKILKETIPKKIKDYGREVINFDTSIWDKHKYNIVKQGNYLKFSQNDKLKKLLLETKDAYLAEASPFDSIWGLGIDKKAAAAVIKAGHDLPGENLLGKALMEVRSNLITN